MAEAGDLDVLGVKYPRMRMLAVAEILAGGRFKDAESGGTALREATLAMTWINVE